MKNINMEITIKGKEVIAYKGMNSDMTCREFQYELGNPYKTDSVELCKCDFHAYLNPRDVLDYYPKNNSRYFKVKLSGEITKCVQYDNTKVAATEITILEEITDTFDEVIETTEWWKNENVLDLLYYSDGFAKVQRGNRLYNFIDKNGNSLSKEWFYWVDYFHEGFAIVQREDKLYNFIDKKGNSLSKEWFYWVSNFHEDFAKVQRGNRLYNFINKNGNYLFTEWFNWVDNFYEGFAKFQREDELYNFIDKQGNILSDDWFRYVYSFNNGFAGVETTNGKWAKINKNGKLLDS